MRRLVVRRHNYGRTPGVAYEGTRYGIAQRPRRPTADEPHEWYGAWPSYETAERAEGVVRHYEPQDPRYDLAVVEFPAEDPAFAVRMERA